MRVGIIGFGRIGAEHAEWLKAAQGVDAVAVADITPARRELAQSRGLETYDSYTALLADHRIDAILVSSATAMHFEHASAALAAGKHVMVEKPMALDLKQSAELVRRANEAGRVLSVFHNRRWDVDYLTVLDAVRQGRFGRLINVESRIGQWASCVGPAAKEWRPQWRNEASFGGGGLYDWGSHFIDQLWQLMLPAKPVRVFAQLRGNVWTCDCDDFARVVIDFDDEGGRGTGGGSGGGTGGGTGGASGGGSGRGGPVGMVEINTTTTRPLPRWHIDGTAGSAESPYSLAFDLDAWAKLDFTPAPRSTPESSDAALTTTAPLPRAAGVLTESHIWQQFAAACRGEGEPAVIAHSVLMTMSLLDAARESSRTGTAVDLAR
ncbi:MAG TPA: Gfo/Idh/MocA family oxidoreductase [Tepidisphaeraceae bacterium]|nr:Gfo/Idh/MocA family oxidoreductase [Tepidisphaeraceae bacterium]